MKIIDESLRRKSSSVYIIFSKYNVSIMLTTTDQCAPERKAVIKKAVNSN